MSQANRRRTAVNLEMIDPFKESEVNEAPLDAFEDDDKAVKIRLPKNGALPFEEETPIVETPF